MLLLQNLLIVTSSTTASSSTISSSISSARHLTLGGLGVVDIVVGVGVTVLYYLCSRQKEVKLCDDEVLSILQ
jgi:hypothetical protein